MAAQSGQCKLCPETNQLVRISFACGERAVPRCHNAAAQFGGGWHGTACPALAVICRLSAASLPSRLPYGLGSRCVWALAAA